MNEVEWFFTHLWKKPRHDLQHLAVHNFPFTIPDTLVYKSGEPEAWYIKSRKEGLILKRNRSNLNSEEIVRKFMKNQQRQKTAMVGTNLTLSVNKDFKQNKRVYELCHHHLSITDFRSMIMYGDKSNFQILQGFVSSKNEYNSVL